MKTNDEMSTNGSDGSASMAGVGTHEVVLDLFRRFVPNSAKVADLAAGEGAFSIRLKELGHDVRAVDASSDNWKVAAILLEIKDLGSDFSASLGEESGSLTSLPPSR